MWNPRSMVRQTAMMPTKPPQKKTVRLCSILQCTWANGFATCNIPNLKGEELMKKDHLSEEESWRHQQHTILVLRSLPWCTISAASPVIITKVIVKDVKVCKWAPISIHQSSRNMAKTKYSDWVSERRVMRWVDFPCQAQSQSSQYALHWKPTQPFSHTLWTWIVWKSNT